MDPCIADAVQRAVVGRVSRDDDSTEAVFVAAPAGCSAGVGLLASTSALRVTAGVPSVATTRPSQQLRDGTITVSSITVETHPDLQQVAGST